MSGSEERGGQGTTGAVGSGVGEPETRLGEVEVEIVGAEGQMGEDTGGTDTLAALTRAEDRETVSSLDEGPDPACRSGPASLPPVCVSSGEGRGFF